jgi:hypothetical protein
MTSLSIRPSARVAWRICSQRSTAAIVNARQDADKLPARLTLKGRTAEAALAPAGIRHIERTVLKHRLMPPTLEDLAACHEKVRGLYSSAYDWLAPPLAPAERTASRTMRQYIKGWITQWDLRRIQDRDVALVSTDIISNYSEDATFSEPQPLDEEDG